MGFESFGSRHGVYFTDLEIKHELNEKSQYIVVDTACYGQSLRLTIPRHRGIAMRVWAPPKSFEPQREHGSKFLGECPDPPGYTPA